MPEVKINGHPHKLAGVPSVAKRGGNLWVDLRLKDVKTDHEQVISVPLAAFHLLPKGQVNFPVYLNGHRQKAIGSGGSEDVFLVELIDETTDHTSTIELGSEIISLLERYKTLSQGVEGLVMLGGTLPARVKNALEAFMKDPDKE